MRGIAGTWAVITMLSVLLGALPFILGWVREAGWEAASPAVIISVFFALYAGSEAVFFRAQANTLDELLTGPDVLAHWTYAERDVQETIDDALGAERSWRSLTLVGLGAGLLSILKVSASNSEKQSLFSFVGLGAAGALALLAAAAVALVRLSCAGGGQRGAPEAFVSREAAYVLGGLHTWRLLGAHVKVAQVIDGSSPRLRIEYVPPWPARIARRGRRPEDLVRSVLIPIPPGEEERARAAALAIAPAPVLAPERVAPEVDQERAPGCNLAHAIVVKISYFGATIELADGKRGFIGVAGLSERFVWRVSSVVSVGDSIEVEPLHCDTPGMPRFRLVRHLS